MLPYGSLALTVTAKPVPAVAEAGAETAKWVAAAAPTSTLVAPDSVPSPALTVWLPAVFSCAFANDATPFVAVTFAGSTACASPEVRWTVPPYEVSMLP